MALYARSQNEERPSYDQGSQDDDTRDDARSHERVKPRRRGGWMTAGFLLILLLLGLGAAALFYYFLHEPLVRDAAAADARVSRLEREVGGLQARLERAETERNEAVAERDRLRAEHGTLVSTVAEREAQIAAMEAATRDLRERLAAEIAEGSVIVTGTGGNLSVGLSDRILFASGSDALSEPGKALLRRVAQSLANVRDRIIHVEGHTDSLQPSTALRQRFPTNWELSAARATNVVRFLSEQAEIPGDRLVASGYSQYRPSATNATEPGRARNRRIELNLLPMRGARPDAE